MGPANIYAPLLHTNQIVLPNALEPLVNFEVHLNCAFALVKFTDHCKFPIQETSSEKKGSIKDQRLKIDFTINRRLSI